MNEGREELLERYRALAHECMRAYRSRTKFREYWMLCLYHGKNPDLKHQSGKVMITVVRNGEPVRMNCVKPDSVIPLEEYFRMRRNDGQG